MSSNLFLKSIKQKSPTKKFDRHMHLDIFAKRKFESEGFKEQVEKIVSNIDFLNEGIKKSVVSEKILFTNFLSERTPSAITGRIREILDDPTVINNGRSDNVNVTEKVKNCINLYYNFTEEENPIVFKSQISDPFNEQTGVRVYAIVESVELGKKADYKVVLIDPFHLVIPSEHRGKKKDKVEKENFDLNKNNSTCMNDYFKPWFE